MNQTTSPNLFAQDEEAILHSTGNIELDGAHVKILGIANDFSKMGYCHYVIAKIDNTPWSNGYTCFAITSHCLKKK